MVSTRIYPPNDAPFSASDILQEAVDAETRRRELESAGQQYMDELAAEVGEPSASEMARAEALVRRIAGR